MAISFLPQNANPLNRPIPCQPVEKQSFTSPVLCQKTHQKANYFPRISGNKIRWFLSFEGVF